MSQTLKSEVDHAPLLATAVGQAAEMILITEVDGTICYVNPAFERINGYLREEAIGQNVRILKSGKHPEEYYRELHKTLASGKPWGGRLINRRKDGSCYDADVTISPVRDETGKTTNYVSVTRDVTQEIALEAQLRQAQKLESIGQLAAGIAHEINTPTQYVGDNTRFLKDGFEGILKLMAAYNELRESLSNGKPDPALANRVDEIAAEVDVEFLIDEIPHAIQESLEGIERVTKIVRAMKEFSHPGTHEKVPYDINKALENTLTVSRNVWKYIADVETDLDRGLPPVPCLPGDINQVLLNIIVNAAHAIGDARESGASSKGLISICTRSDEDFAEIRISDSGTGIPEAVRGRIFDPFFTTKEVGKGTGQGLAISHSVVVEKHGGTINFETEMGKGTTFIIRLPQMSVAA